MCVCPSVSPSVYLSVVRQFTCPSVRPSICLYRHLSVCHCLDFCLLSLSLSKFLSPSLSVTAALHIMLYPLQLEQRGVNPPRVDFVKKKNKQIDEARNFQFKEEDIEKVHPPLIPRSSPLTPHPSPLTARHTSPSPLILHTSPLTAPHTLPSPLTPHPSPLTPHPSHLTSHCSSYLTPHCSSYLTLTPHPSPVPAHYLLQILQEKQKFRKAPTNYAMTKSRLLRLKVHVPVCTQCI